MKERYSKRGGEKEDEEEEKTTKETLNFIGHRLISQNDVIRKEELNEVNKKMRFRKLKIQSVPF